MSLIVTGLIKELGGFSEIGTGAMLLGAAAGLAASAAALPLLGAVALVGLATFAITDGAMTILDGTGDIVEGASDIEVPSLNAYDIVASEMGEGAMVGLAVTRTGLTFVGFVSLTKAMDENDVKKVMDQVLGLAVDVTSTGLAISDSLGAAPLTPE